MAVHVTGDKESAASERVRVGGIRIDLSKSYMSGTHCAQHHTPLSSQCTGVWATQRALAFQNILLCMNVFLPPSLET